LKKSLSFTSTRLAVAVVLGAIVAIVALTSTADSAAPAPAVTTGQGHALSATSARVNGIVNPQGQSTTYIFQYGATTSYGLQTSPASAGSSTGDVAVHKTLSGLTPNGTYHYRLVAHSSSGTNYGSDQTVSLAPAVSQVAFMGHMGFVSPGDVIGVEAGCFGGDTTCTGQVTMTPVDPSPQWRFPEPEDQPVRCLTADAQRRLAAPAGRGERHDHIRPVDLRTDVAGPLGLALTARRCLRSV
jgi:hypothetical protein